MTPDEARQIQQASRAAFSARGTTGTNQSTVDELISQYDFGQNLLRQRQQFAGGVLGANANVVGDPFQQILGRSSGAVAGAGNVLQTSGPSLFNPESGYAGNVANANQQMAALFADPSVMDKIGQVTNTGTLGLLGKGGSY